MSLYPKRTVHVPRRFDPNDFVPGANNKYTAGREIDAGQSVETEADRYEEVVSLDEDFIVGDVLSEESECEESEGEWDCDESEGEWDSEESECVDCEWDSEESECEDCEGEEKNDDNGEDGSSSHESICEEE